MLVSRIVGVARLLFESCDYFVQHFWSCGDYLRAASDRANTVIYQCHLIWFAHSTLSVSNCRVDGRYQSSHVCAKSCHPLQGSSLDLYFTDLTLEASASLLSLAMSHKTAILERDRCMRTPCPHRKWADPRFAASVVGWLKNIYTRFEVHSCCVSRDI